MHLVKAWPQRNCISGPFPLRKKGNYTAPVTLLYFSLCASPAFTCGLKWWPVSLCAGRHWKDVSHLVHRWYVLDQTVRDVRGGTQTPKHIRVATRLEEVPGVSHKESHLLTLGVAWTWSSVACWQQPREYDLAGMVRGAPQAWGGQTKGADAIVEETILGRGFGEIVGE